MRYLRTHVVAVVLILVAAPLLDAQTADPSGHWEATMQLPSGDLRFELDLDRNPTGEIAGTIGTPAQHLIGLPLARVVLDGRTITFFAREDQPFTGELLADGQTITGNYRLEGQSIPLTLTRTGPPTHEAGSQNHHHPIAVGRHVERNRQCRRPRRPSCADDGQPRGWNVHGQPRQPGRGPADRSDHRGQSARARGDDRIHGHSADRSPAARIPRAPRSPGHSPRGRSACRLRSVARPAERQPPATATETVSSSGSARRWWAATPGAFALPQHTSESCRKVTSGSHR